MEIAHRSQLCRHFWQQKRREDRFVGEQRWRIAEFHPKPGQLDAFEVTITSLEALIAYQLGFKFIAQGFGTGGDRAAPARHGVRPEFRVRVLNSWRSLIGIPVSLAALTKPSRKHSPWSTAYATANTSISQGATTTFPSLTSCRGRGQAMTQTPYRKVADTQEK
jgi:hypothetical protein